MQSEPEISSNYSALHPPTIEDYLCSDMKQLKEPIGPHPFLGGLGRCYQIRERVVELQWFRVIVVMTEGGRRTLHKFCRDKRLERPQQEV